MLATLLASMLIAGRADALHVNEGSTGDDPATGHHWRMDRARSTLTFATVAAGEPVRGSFTDWQAAVVFNPARPSAARIAVTVPVVSIRTDMADADALLATADFFERARFPMARFVSTSVRPRGGSRFDVTGILTVNGQRRTVVLPVNIAIRGGHARATGQLTVDRRWFSVGRRAWSDIGMLQAGVVINFTLVADRIP